MTPQVQVAILVRVSTRKQETDRQVHELLEVARLNQWHVHEVIEETVSGNAKVRTGLDRVIELASTNQIQKVLVHEVSRVSRKNSTSHVFLDALCEHGVSLYWHAHRIETLLPDGRRNPAASIMFTLLAEMARAERELLVERINSGLDEARRKGVRLGRSHGAEPTTTFLAKHGDIVSLLRAGKSVRDIEARTGKAKATVLKVRRHVLKTTAPA